MTLDRAEAVATLDKGLKGSTRHPLQEDVHAAHGVEVIVYLLGRLRVWSAVEELQRSNRGLHFVRS